MILPQVGGKGGSLFKASHGEDKGQQVLIALVLAQQKKEIFLQ